MLIRRLAAASAVLLTLTACGDDGSSDEQAEDTGGAAETDRTHAPQPESPDGVECTYQTGGAPAERAVDPPSDRAPYGEDVSVVIETTAGDIPAVLDAAAAPCTVNSFTSLASQGYFDDTPCHRLTTQGIYVLQCGDPSGSGMGGPGYSFPDELTGSETYGPGTLAMANSGPDTNGSQFFIVYGDSPLPPAYTVFGEISEEGLQVVEEIAEKGTDTGAGDGAPAEPVQIEYVGVG